MRTDESPVAFIRELLKGYNIKLDSSDVKVYLYLALFDEEQTRQSSDTGFGSECFETDEFSLNKSYQKAEVEELKFTNTALDLLAKKTLDAMLIDKTGRLSEEIKVHFQQGYSEIHNNISDFVVWLKVLSGDLG